MSPMNRFLLLRRKGYCFQCLLPGGLMADKKHKDGRCQRNFVCQHSSHIKYPTRKHALVCEEHKDDVDNLALLQNYKERCIIRQKSTQLPEFSKEIKLSFTSSTKRDAYKSAAVDIISNNGIYQLQTIKIDEHHYTLFFDIGCGDFVS